MPCHIHFDGDILRLDFEDVVTTPEFFAALTKVEGLEKASTAVPHRIADLTKTTGLTFGFTEMLAFVERRKSLRFRNAFKSAIVAPQSVHVGLARMFQTLNDHPQITVAIFPDLEAAKAWIAQP